MESPTARSLRRRFMPALGGLLIGAIALGLVAPASADVTVTVQAPAQPGGTPTPVTGFRYTIQEDLTYPVVPDVTGVTGDASTAAQDTLSLRFHRSYMPVVKVGTVRNASSFTWSSAPVAPGVPAHDPTKRYFVSVMPINESFGGTGMPSGFTMNGVGIPAGASSVTVPVNPLPFQTAQISVFLFEDDGPINGAADAPGEQEMPLCGFEVQLFEAGGTYGASGGRVSTDTFGNPLGTEYFDPPQYNVDGSLKVKTLGANQLWSDRNGVVRIKNLSPAKYTIYSIPPASMPSRDRCNLGDAARTPIWVASEPANGGNLLPGQMYWRTRSEIAVNEQTEAKWHQTTTIEGTWGVDAWVKAGEPAYFKEFGPPGHHVWHGFVRRFKDTTALNGNVTLHGTVVSSHMTRPPAITFRNGAPMDACWIGINEVTTGVGLGRAVYANACADSASGLAPGEFRITNLRPNTRYQLSVWDEPLDNVIGNYEFTTGAAGSTLELNQVPVFSWFSNLRGKVFLDKEETAFPYTGSVAKPGIPNSIVNLRFRDGSIYQSTVTDDAGQYEFAEVFPFFNWLVAETDFTRFKATGATIVVDDGGIPVNPPAGQPDLWPAATMTPQLQPDNGNLPYRIFGGNPSSGNLLQAFQGFLGQTNVIHWGKREYNPADRNDHGGITGVVHYASTRAENDPKFATAENNEPGIPNVEIRLYRIDPANRKVIVPGGTVGTVNPADANATHAVQIVATDSFDAGQPEGCVDPRPYRDATMPSGTDFGRRCYDGMRIWNQVRDGVFDGGFGFVDYCPTGVDPTTGACNGNAAPLPLPPGYYMVEGVAPYGYEHQKEEDKNVDFGDLLVPGPLANPAECIGSRTKGFTYNDQGVPVAIPALVPGFLDLFSDVPIDDRFGPGTARPYCDKKLVVLAPGMNPFADFHMFTKAPVAGHIVGMILDDLANEFDPYAPSFGEKYAPPFMPISIRDFAGNEINRVYSDRYGTYNALVPSTFAFNVPMPSGVAPNMVNVCLNSPTMKDPADPTKTIVDPHYNPSYSQFCYTFQYLPGKTTYLDTPVLPLAAFAGPSQTVLDCEQPEATPGIKRVTNAAGSGPWLAVASGGTITIESMGVVDVPNPAYNPNYNNASYTGSTPNPEPKTIKRDFGFGALKGRVLIGGSEIAPAAVTWTNASISVAVPANHPGGTIEVVASSSDLFTAPRSARGATLHMLPSGQTPVIVPDQQPTIQKGIDAATEGQLVIVKDGLYEESPILWKRVRVQGVGAPVTIVNASHGVDTYKTQAWREKVCDLVVNQGMASALVTGQVVPANLAACLTGNAADNAPPLFASEEASGFFVLQKPVADPTLATLARLQIDGFTITGADTGGGIVANGHAAKLEISNNRITGNQGLYNGGIRIGHADLRAADEIVGSNNLLVSIHHNEILKNGNLAGEVTGGGGGISIYTGSRGYSVASNYICGNFSTGDGGGMAHFGASGTFSSGTTVVPSTVTNNRFVFNQSFSQAKSVQGGGLAIIGMPDPVAASGISLGTGSVTVASNTFLGNLAGAGDGGGIAMVGVNGNDILALPLSTSASSGRNNRAAWNRIDVLNNVIVNNGAGVTGGGISLFDSPNVRIVNNTIAMNDSYATAARAFAPNSPSQSTLQRGAGIAAYVHSPALVAATLPTLPLISADKAFSAATIENSVVVGNRRFLWKSTGSTTCGYPDPANPGAGNTACFGLVGAPSQTPTAGQPQWANRTNAHNDIGVVAQDNQSLASVLLVLSPTRSVFTRLNAADGTGPLLPPPLGTTTNLGVTTSTTDNTALNTALGADFTGSYYNGNNGSSQASVLKQLIYAVEQSVVIGAPVLEVQEPSPPGTAAAFDEGGNFIDVRFGPLTTGYCTGATRTTDCTSGWTFFGTYGPTTAATNNTTGHFRQAGNLYGAYPLLQKDRNGRDRPATGTNNWIRGALNQ